MTPTCSYLKTCPFFRAFGDEPSNDIQGMVGRYCTGDASEECWRLKYSQRFGDQPSKFITPSGKTFPALSQTA